MAQSQTHTGHAINSTTCAQFMCSKHLQSTCVKIHGAVGDAFLASVGKVVNSSVKIICLYEIFIVPSSNKIEASWVVCINWYFQEYSKGESILYFQVVAFGWFHWKYGTICLISCWKEKNLLCGCYCLLEICMEQISNFKQSSIHLGLSWIVYAFIFFKNNIYDEQYFLLQVEAVR